MKNSFTFGVVLALMTMVFSQSGEAQEKDWGPKLIKKLAAETDERIELVRLDPTKFIADDGSVQSTGLELYGDAVHVKDGAIVLAPSAYNTQLDEAWVNSPEQAASAHRLALENGYAGVAYIYVDGSSGSWQVAQANNQDLVHSFTAEEMKAEASMQTMLAGFDTFGDRGDFSELDQEWMLATNNNTEAIEGDNYYVTTSGRRGGFFQRLRRAPSGGHWMRQNPCGGGSCGRSRSNSCSGGNYQVVRPASFSQPSYQQQYQPQQSYQPQQRYAQQSYQPQRQGWRNAVGGPNCETCNLGLLAGPRNLLNGNFVKYRPRTRCDFMNLNVKQRLFSRAFPRLAFNNGLVGCCTANALLGQRFLAIVIGVSAGTGGGAVGPGMPSPPPVLPPIFIGKADMKSMLNEKFLAQRILA